MKPLTERGKMSMSEVSLNKDFKQKLFEKIQSDIGSLLGEEEMKALVTTAFERTFFEPRRTPQQFGSDRIDRIQRHPHQTRDRHSRRGRLRRAHARTGGRHRARRRWRGCRIGIGRAG